MKNHYDMIPEELFHGRILDVGCGDGSNQHQSKHADLLYSCDYTGIDVTLGTDLFEYEPNHAFDLVLAIHVAEHIPIERWDDLFDRLQRWTAKGGHLVIGTPYRQPRIRYSRFTGPENQRHRVFDIDEDLIGQYIWPITYMHYKGPYSPSLMCIWRH